MKPSWKSLLRHSPLRKFFWTPAGIWGNLGESPAARGGSQPRSIRRFQEVRPLPETSPAVYHHTYYVAELAPAKIVGDVTLVALPDDLVLDGLQRLHAPNNPADHWVLKRSRFRRPKRLAGTAVLLASAAASNYFHWLFDSLPRLHLLGLAGFDLATADWFLLNQFCSGFHAETLDILGIPAEKRLKCSKQTILEVDRLVAPSMPSPPGFCPAWACEFLRGKFLPPGLGPATRKIYVSRQLARGRRLSNESEILPWLEKRGFETAFMERLSFREQVALFASARIIVGVHGAGMSNLVFAQAGGAVMEFFAPTYPSWSYTKLAETMNLKYQAITGVVGPRRVKAKSPELADVYVDPAEVRRRVEAMGG